MTTNNLKKYCLFAGRHELPANEGALFSDFNFENFTPVPTQKYFEAMEEVKRGNSVSVYVTGLTPALTHFLSEVRDYKGKVHLLHYNSQTKEYMEQEF